MKKLYSSILIALRIHGRNTGLGKGQGHAKVGSDRGDGSDNEKWDCE